jgi:hypothetical protein
VLGLQLFPQGNEPLPQTRRNAAASVSGNAKRLHGLEGVRSIRCAGKGSAVLKERAQPLPTEHEEQREVVFWFRRKFSDVRIFAIPNGGWRSRATAAKLKAEGVSRGVPDLFVPAWGLWVEMKRSQGGRLSPDQKSWHLYLASIGQTVLVCYGADDAKRQIEAHIKAAGF